MPCALCVRPVLWYVRSVYALCCAVRALWLPVAALCCAVHGLCMRCVCSVYAVLCYARSVRSVLCCARSVYALCLPVRSLGMLCVVLCAVCSFCMLGTKATPHWIGVLGMTAHHPL